MDIQTQLLTNEAFRVFEQRHKNVDKRYELHEGIAVEMPSPCPLHNFIVARIVYFLVAYLLNHDIGYAFGDNMDFDLAPSSSIRQTQPSCPKRGCPNCRMNSR